MVERFNSNGQQAGVQQHGNTQRPLHGGEGFEEFQIHGKAQLFGGRFSGGCGCCGSRGGVVFSIGQVHGDGDGAGAALLVFRVVFIVFGRWLLHYFDDRAAYIQRDVVDCAQFHAHMRAARHYSDRKSVV